MQPNICVSEPRRARAGALGNINSSSKERCVSVSLTTKAMSDTPTEAGTFRIRVATAVDSWLEYVPGSDPIVRLKPSNSTNARQHVSRPFC